MSKSKGTGLFARLAKTRSRLMQGISNLLQQDDLPLDELLEDLEEQLIMADIGLSTAASVIEGLRQQLHRKRPESRTALLQMLKQQMLSKLDAIKPPPGLAAGKPGVILLLGVNGVGKTTTAAKLAAALKKEGKQVMLAACDTFRAAAIEQLQDWGRRLDVPVISAQHGADAAAVAHDAWQSAQANSMDVLIIDSAGRQHTNNDLMQQLQKLKRVIHKLDAAAPQEVLLVVDAGTGQNAISQFEKFHAALGVTGICLSKLDGTAKGGIALALIEQYKVAVKYLGTGERAEDLQPFVATDYLDAMLPEDQP